jgi:16S rRNA pseudouridine516 synthase
MRRRPAPDNVKPHRLPLERLLQQQGFGSRRACAGLVLAGRVQVQGTRCEDPLAVVDTEGLHFSVDGAEWPYMAFATVVLHKPAGYECSRAPQHHRSVLELLPPPLRERGVQPVGRLDQDTTGLLILTDDGSLNHALASGRRGVSKTYRATTRHPVSDEQILALLAGVVLHDDPQPVRALRCERLAERELRIVVSEGRYHQVKRMLSAAGNRVEALHREAIGAFLLPESLAPGAWRWLEAAGKEALLTASP